MSINELMRRLPMNCARCGAIVPPGGSIEACGCWEQCSCGWTAEKGKPCNNPNTTRCSTKARHKQYKVNP